MLRKIILLSLLLIFFLSTVNADSDYDAYQWYLKGRYFYKAGKIIESYSALQKAVSIKSDYKEALELIERIEKIAEFEQIKLEREIRTIREAQEKIREELPSPEPEIKEPVSYPWDEVHFRMGENYLKQNRLDLAEQEFIETLRIYPDNVLAEYYLFRIYSTRDDFDRVIEQAEKIRTFIQPYILWKRLKDQGDYDNISSVIKDISMYFRYFPNEDFDEKFIREFRCYRNRKLLEKAYYQYTNLINMKTFFKNSFPYRIISELNDYKEDITDFSQEILVENNLISTELKCGESDYYFYHGKIYCPDCSLVKPEENVIIAIEPEKESLEDVRDRNEYMKLRDTGDRFLDRHKYESALLSYLEALRYFPSSYDVANKIGVVYELMGNTDEAEKYFRKSIELRFDFIPAFNNLASVLYKREKYDDAVILLKKALIIKDTDFNIHYNLGLNYEKMDKFELAKEHYTISTLINGSEPDPYVRLAIVCRNLGEFDKGIDYLGKAKAIVGDNPDMRILIDELIAGYEKEKNTKQ